ncbi:MAG: hypothetical protein IT372_19650 [Polyangiaceae bacterium]|nr:hypothetical protein [Polyangiaceae bacterium]
MTMRLTRWACAALLLGALAGTARAQAPEKGTGDLPPPPPPPPGATTPGGAAPAPEPAPVSVPAPAPVSVPAPPAPGMTPQELRIERRNKAIRERWEWIIGGSTIFAANYSLMVLFAATGEVTSADESTGRKRDLDVLYIPVAGPVIAMAQGEIEFDDAGPIPLLDALFQGLGLASVIVGVSLPDPEAEGYAVHVGPAPGGAAVSMTGRF